MRGMIDLIKPLEGLDTAAAQVNRVASKIAQSGNPSDRVDLSEQMVELMKAQNDFEANTKVLQTEDRMTHSLLEAAG